LVIKEGSVLLMHGVTMKHTRTYINMEWKSSSHTIINSSTLVETVWKSSGIAVQLKQSTLTGDENDEHRIDVLQTYFLTDLINRQL